MAETRRTALVVVTSKYGDGKLTELRAPPQDAVALAEVLGDPNVGCFDVHTLSDPSCQELREEVEEFFADRTSEHTLLLHFSCHGVKDAAGTLFLATMDTRCDRLASTAVPAEYVSSLMLASRARRAVVILDCCYAGAFERGLLTRADTDAHVGESFQGLRQISDTSQRGRAVMAACSAVQSASEGPHAEGAEAVQPSFFTRSVVKGLRSGDADLDGNGEIGVSELHQYVCDQLRELTPHQTPGIWVFGAHGRDLPIARAPARRIGPAPLPEDLAALVRSPSPADRLWAIEDLESVLQSDEIGLALTAVTTLEELEGDDSRRVAHRAERAKRSALPRIGPKVLDLGTVPLDSFGPAAVITVEGPPVAHSRVEATTDAPWLTVNPLADGGAVQVKTKRLPGPGNHQGNVLVRTATGEAAVQVVVEAQPQTGRADIRTDEAEARANTARSRVRKDPPQWGPQPPRRDVPESMPFWPFFWTSALLAIALVTLLTVDDPGFYLWSGFQGGSGLLVWPGLLLSLVVNSVLAVRTFHGIRALRAPVALWGYAGMTALNMLGAGVAVAAYDTTPQSVMMSILLIGACAAEVTGSCLSLRRARPAMKPGT